ncbi:hypothetical protein IA57_12135 [Mangrovimonas yunxiaonensis]|uniref:TIGR02453 family protein n=1 Tax=Mangrovimonas yunxiaonensis TaxID=1197477 RepID=A0A084THI5_9FLAO|nr:DUF2461 domain-containing protein [Mangrovimonas yunxiaonensis]KFB00171.1 hypothetical protein IA57_12135 [Mangrovimonas yunxiaonensis]MBR9757789.1 DUF2461 domain-containing protein [Algicola sp.]GGH42315.1 TIGR02453 family protein [Mangrovimonas yunxiaonensis]
MKTTPIPIELLNFFKQLEKNNNRDWFNAHKSDFKRIEANVKQAYEKVMARLNEHDTIDALKMFRIYRDVRFSKNKQPYKTHIGGTFHRKKPELRGGYYLQLAPNNQSFIATGFWAPNKDDLMRVRKEFEADSEDLRSIINNPSFKAVWGDLVGDEVKTAPRGFDKNHPAIDLIKKKQYIFTKTYTDSQVTSEGFIDEVSTSFKAVRPFFDYMSSVLTTNLNGESII